MAEGFAAVVRATSAEHARAPAEVMAIAGRSFLSAVGATTGPLSASAMLSASQRLDGKATLSAADLAGLVPSFADGIAQRGNAEPLPRHVRMQLERGQQQYLRRQRHHGGGKEAAG